jgi:folate-binding protein YgfZ
MDDLLYQQVMTEGGWVDLSARAKWRLSGADRVRYLNGQVTQDVRAANQAETLYACVTNLKGKVEGDLFMHASTDRESLILDAEPGLQENLGLRLEKYIIADDAELVDITAEWMLWHVFGTRALASQDWAALGAEAGGYALRSNRFYVAGLDLWLPVGSTSAKKPEVPFLSDEEAETFRILQQVPRFPNELNPDSFPPEAGLETRAMSFTKGCYIGQEVLSRIKTTGRMPRQLIAWEAADAKTAVAMDDSIFAEKEQGTARSIGKVTSVTRHPQRGTLAGLGYVKQGSGAADSVLLVGDDMPRIDACIKICPSVNP